MILLRILQMILDQPGGTVMESIRIDKWLWAARFFKTRALASKACDLGRIRANGLAAKPAREVRVGDRLEVNNEGGVTARAKPALRRAPNSWPSARQCRSSRRFPSTVLPSATAAASFSSVVEPDRGAESEGRVTGTVSG
jgi:hypothetical protein